ncbi:MAG: aromatic amino acid transport family protein [Patescibacteria group bacterium]
MILFRRKVHMEAKNKVFWRSVYPLVGSVIGVGIFGLPYAFAQAGFGIGMIHMAVIIAVNMLTLIIYADIVINTNGHPRLPGIVRRFLGEQWSWLATFLHTVGIWGAMIAYIIIGGQFLHALFSPVLGGGLMLFQLIFFSVCSLLLIGGLGFISKLEVYFVIALLLMLFVILTGSLPYFDVDNLSHVNAQNWFLPFGVVLFAFGGFAAIPEMAQVLGRYKNQLSKSIILGVTIVSIVYLVFSGVVVAVTGQGTSEEAIIGLGDYVGPWVLVVGAIIGLISVFTSFLILGISAMDTFIYDYKQRFLPSWLVTIIVPLVIYLAGARSFIGVIGFTGGLIVSLTGLLVIYTYFKAKKSISVSKRCFRYPNWILYFCALVFIFGAIATLLGL